VAVAAAVVTRQPYAIVSRGGRLDLIGDILPKLESPIQLIAGEKDPETLALNRSAYKQIQTVKRLSLIRDASHLFEEPGCLDKVAQLAIEWFTRYLPHHE
jgi:putative phosphoribosyl transferase